MARVVLFLDDGGVMNDRALRVPQWHTLVGAFFPPILGGTAEAWGAANRVMGPLWEEYLRMYACQGVAAYQRAYLLAWLRGMCERVGVPVPPEDESLELARRASAYVTRRVRSAFPGAVEAIRELHARGYALHTASGEDSDDLAGYLEGMGVRECFGRLYGPDLVNTLKYAPEGTAYYTRIFADAGVAPVDALVVDDSPAALRWAADAGARTALVGVRPDDGFLPDLTLGSLSELPRALSTLEAEP